MSSFTDDIFDRLKNAGNEIIGGVSDFAGGIIDNINRAKKSFREQTREDLTWFSRQIEAQSIQSDTFFEKYLVVGCPIDSLHKMSQE